MEKRQDFGLDSKDYSKAQKIGTGLLLLGLMWCLTSCLGQPDSGSASGTHVVTNPSPALPPLTTPERTICDPFNTNSPQAQNRGLVGTLFYLTDAMPRYTNVADYIANGVVVPSTIYLDRVFIPTRAFDLGFTTQSGNLIVNDQGLPMYEYFALRMESQLQLGVNDPAGYYQLGMLADDGAIITIKDAQGVDQVIVNDDGTHSTTMAEASQSIYLDHTTKIPIVIEYYQGPRYHIALTVMWRPWPDGVTNTVIDPLNGQSGNSLFFDSTQVPSTPQTAFLDLLSRDWRVLQNENYAFPAQASNPCASTVEDTLVISAFSIVQVTRNQATLSWTTNIAATSAIELTDNGAGSVSQVGSDPAMVTSHSVTITGLSPFSLYGVKGISHSAGGQQVLSDQKAFRTLR